MEASFSLSQRAQRPTPATRTVTIDGHRVSWGGPNGEWELWCDCEMKAVTLPGAGWGCKFKHAARALREHELQQEYDISIRDGDRSAQRLMDVVVDLARRAAEGEWVGQVDANLHLQSVARIIDVPADSVWRYLRDAVDDGHLVVDRNVVKAS